MTSSFNPRAREGRDGMAGARALAVGVSIHAPVKGATRHKQQLGRRLCFNPRAREGRDRVRRTWLRCTRSFNPRAREGRDTAEINEDGSPTVFQSTRP